MFLNRNLGSLGSFQFSENFHLKKSYARPSLIRGSIYGFPIQSYIE